MLKKAIICDIDGTIADIFHRLHWILDTPENPNWDKFYENLLQDKPVLPIISLLKNYKKLGYIIIFITGRVDKYKKETLEWFKLNKIPFDFIYFRKNGDYREDFVIKSEIYFNFIKDKFMIDFVLDDLPKVVNMWKSLGLLVLQPQFIKT